MSQPSLLTLEQVKELRDLCSGLEIELGTSWRAKHLRCFQEAETKRKVTRIGKTIISFPKDEAADRWNKRMEAEIRHFGHIATAIVTVIVTLATKRPGVGIGVGTGAGITKDELQARIEYPYARRDWRIEIESTTTYQQNALGTDYIEFSYRYIGYDHQGVVKYQSKLPLNGRIAQMWGTRFEIGEEMNRIPREVALNMLALSSEVRHITYE